MVETEEKEENMRKTCDNCRFYNKSFEEYPCYRCTDYKYWVSITPESSRHKATTKRFHDDISWHPKKQFEEETRPCNAMTFGYAIEAMKRGKKVARAGWNDKGMFIFLVDEAVGFKRVGYNGENCDIRLHQHIAINTTGIQTTNEAAPKSIVPWVASQTDMLAGDWQIVD